MIGCRHNAKNTLDLNYLYLAEKRGLTIVPDTEGHLRPFPRPEGGYDLEVRGRALPALRPGPGSTTGRTTSSSPAGCWAPCRCCSSSRSAATGCRSFSDRLGPSTCAHQLRGAHRRGPASGATCDMSRGYRHRLHPPHRRAHSHLEPVSATPSGSGAFRLLDGPRTWPARAGGPRLVRLLLAVLAAIRVECLARLPGVPDWAKNTMILLLHADHRRPPADEARARVEHACSGAGPPPPCRKVRCADGSRPHSRGDGACRARGREGGRLASEPGDRGTVLGNLPTTAHILGGCCMGRERGAGRHRPTATGSSATRACYVIDGSAVSANPGVNPSLTIAALAEHTIPVVLEWTVSSYRMAPLVAEQERG